MKLLSFEKHFKINSYYTLTSLVSRIQDFLNHYYLLFYLTAIFYDRSRINVYFSLIVLVSIIQINPKKKPRSVSWEALVLRNWWPTFTWGGPHYHRQWPISLLNLRKYLRLFRQTRGGQFEHITSSFFPKNPFIDELFRLEAI